ncbi:MAG: site-2 protease family protein [bacterium]
MNSRWSDWSRWSLQLLKVWGIPIRLHASVILIVPLLFFMDVSSAKLFLFFLAGMLTSITLHELGHCFMAMRQGCRVNEILLLFPIGGMARMDHISTRPRDEALMAIAGPIVSLTLFVALFFGGKFLPLTPLGVDILRIHFVANIIQLLGIANLILFGFNLIPAFPMDGGRILRAWLSNRLGRLRATFVASLLGKAGAVILLLAGISLQTCQILPLGLISVFVYILAGQEYRTVERQEGLKAFGFDPSGKPSEEDWQDRVVIGPPPYKTTGKPQTATPIVRERRRSPRQ